MRSPVLSVVIPAYNEAAAPSAVAPARQGVSRAAGKRVRDTSSSTTARPTARADVAEAILAPLGERGRVLRNPSNLGKGASVRRGMLAARGTPRALLGRRSLRPHRGGREAGAGARRRAPASPSGRARWTARWSSSGSPGRATSMGRLFNLVVRVFAVRGIQRHAVRLQALRRRRGGAHLRARPHRPLRVRRRGARRWRSASASRSPRCRCAGATTRIPG